MYATIFKIYSYYRTYIHLYCYYLHIVTWFINIHMVSINRRTEVRYGIVLVFEEISSY